MTPEPPNPFRIDPHAGATEPREAWDEPAALPPGRVRAPGKAAKKRSRTLAERAATAKDATQVGEPVKKNAQEVGSGEKSSTPNIPGPPPRDPIEPTEGTGSALLRAARAAAPDRPRAVDAALTRFGRRLAASVENGDRQDDGVPWGPEDAPPEMVAFVLDLLCDGIPKEDGSRSPPDGRTAPNLAAIVRRFPGISTEQAYRALTVARQAIADGVASQAATEGAVIKDAIWRNINLAERQGRPDHAIAGLRTLAAIVGLSHAGESQTARAGKLTDEQLDLEIQKYVRSAVATMPADELARLRSGPSLLEPAAPAEGTER